MVKDEKFRIKTNIRLTCRAKFTKGNFKSVGSLTFDRSYPVDDRSVINGWGYFLENSHIVIQRITLKCHFLYTTSLFKDGKYARNFFERIMFCIFS